MRKMQSGGTSRTFYESPWGEWAQSSNQSFYFFFSVTIDETPIEPNDWVGAFCNGIHVGALQWDTSQCNGGVCEVMAMGDDGQSWTSGYCQDGDTVTFEIYDASAAAFYPAQPSENILWQNNTGHLITSLSTTSTEEFQTLNYDMIVGGNLVAFPLSNIEGGSSLDNVLAEFPVGTGIIGQGIAAVLWPDGWAGTLLELVPSDGYWVVLPDNAPDTAVSVTGQPLYYQSYNLTGADTWPAPFLVSFDGEDGTPLENALAGYEGIITQVIGQGVAVIYSNGNWIGNLTTLKRQDGYWIFLESGISNFQWAPPQTQSTSGFTYMDVSLPPDLHNANIPDVFQDLMNQVSGGVPRPLQKIKPVVSKQTFQRGGRATPRLQAGGHTCPSGTSLAADGSCIPG